MVWNQHKYNWRFSGQSSGSAYYQAYVCLGVMNRGVGGMHPQICLFHKFGTTLRCLLLSSTPEVIKTELQGKWGHALDEEHNLRCELQGHLPSLVSI